MKAACDSFRTAYRRLEDRMRDLAESDGAVFLPNPEPEGPVDYVFVCMEPSLGWCRSVEAARAKVEAGSRNFLSSIEDFLLHFSARRYLCRPGERYHLTDFSKGAMRVVEAGAGRAERYDRWWPLLREELELVAAPGAQVVAVGGAVFAEHQSRKLDWPLHRILHYSRRAGKARSDAVKGLEEEFERFRPTVSTEDVVAEGEDVLAASGMPAELCAKQLRRLKRRALTESQKKLVFSYRNDFELLRHGRERDRVSSR